MIALALGALTLAAWLHVVLGRGGFWRARDRDDVNEPSEPVTWPPVTAVVPARDEADVIARSIGSLLAQDYPGELRVVLVDDNSTDGTASGAREEAARQGSDRLEVLAGAPLPAGWTGKLWAVSQGVARAGAQPEFLLLTDADIGHAPENLRKLVARAMTEDRVLVSLLAKLHCRSAAERFLIPAFVYFFDMLYPFGRVSDPKSKVAAAAGGVMLIRREALERAGGVAAIRREIIDDCAMGRLLKRQGSIRLHLTERAVSLRPYAGVGEIGRMVSRSAYAQLGYSPWLLAGTLAGMVLTYILPVVLPIVTIASPNGLTRLGGVLGFLALDLMLISYAPIVRFYRAPWAWVLALPAVGAAYTLFTVQSALDVWRGRGGQWKGRAQARLHEATA